MRDNIISIHRHRYQKYAKVSGEIDLSLDATYINKINNTNNLEKEYIKAYIKLLSQRGD